MIEDNRSAVQPVTDGRRAVLQLVHDHIEECDRLLTTMFGVNGGELADDEREALLELRTAKVHIEQAIAREKSE